MSIRLWTFSSSRTGGIGLMMTCIGTWWTSLIPSEWIDLLSLFSPSAEPDRVDIIDLFLRKNPTGVTRTRHDPNIYRLPVSPLPCFRRAWFNGSLSLVFLTANQRRRVLLVCQQLLADNLEKYVNMLLITSSMFLVIFGVSGSITFEVDMTSRQLRQSCSKAATLIWRHVNVSPVIPLFLLCFCSLTSPEWTLPC